MIDEEILKEFVEESRVNLSELENILEELEDDCLQISKYADFGQIIDRIMGAAKSIGAEEIGLFCELGKKIGYKASQIEDQKILTIVVAVLFDSIDLLKKMISSLEEGNNKILTQLNTQAFASRLKWVSEKFKHIERSSCDVEAGEDADLSQDNIDKLLESLDL